MSGAGDQGLRSEFFDQLRLGGKGRGGATRAFEMQSWGNGRMKLVLFDVNGQARKSEAWIGTVALNVHIDFVIVHFGIYHVIDGWNKNNSEFGDPTVWNDICNRQTFSVELFVYPASAPPATSGKATGGSRVQ